MDLNQLIIGLDLRKLLTKTKIKDAAFSPPFQEHKQRNNNNIFRDK